METEQGGSWLVEGFLCTGVVDELFTQFCVLLALSAQFCVSLMFAKPWLIRMSVRRFRSLLTRLGSITECDDCCGEKVLVHGLCTEHEGEAGSEEEVVSLAEYFFVKSACC